MEDSTIIPGGGSQGETPTQAEQSATALVEKHRKQRSDKGKPRGARKAEPDTQACPPPIDPVLQLNIELVKKSITALVGTIDSIVVNKVYNKATRLGCDKNIATEYAQNTGLSKSEGEIISECTAVIMARSDFLIRHAPEVMLGCVCISYSVRVLSTMRRLNEIEESFKKAKKIPTGPTLESGAQ